MSTPSGQRPTGAPCAQTSVLLLLPAVMEDTHHGRVEDVSVGVGGGQRESIRSMCSGTLGSM